MASVKVGKKTYRKGKRITKVRTLLETPCKKFMVAETVVDLKYFDKIEFGDLKKMLGKVIVVGLTEV